ncbi:MAG: LCP family protein [Ruminococcus sp.]|nr:LCP family protein [Ruminococcus sp.]
MIYYYSVLNSMNFVDISDTPDKSAKKTDSTVPQVDMLSGDGTQLSLTEGELLQDSKVLNVMLFGEDNSDGEEHGRTDTMIMLSIDNHHKKIKLTSFQRDTYVYIPDNGYNKINASYTLGGAKLAIKTIEANFGIKIDRYAVVDFESFTKIIDTLGGIDLELTADEIEYINYQMYKNEQVDSRYTITDQPGTVHLNGMEALWYARDRGLTIGEDDNEIGIDGDDWDRTSRQRNLLTKLFNDMKSADITQIISIVGSVGPLITTNLKKDEITALVSHATTYLQYSVEQYYVPKEGLWYYDDDTPVGSAIRISDLDAQRFSFAKFVYEDLIPGEEVDYGVYTATEPTTLYQGIQY